MGQCSRSAWVLGTLRQHSSPHRKMRPDWSELIERINGLQFGSRERSSEVTGSDVDVLIKVDV